MIIFLIFDIQSGNGYVWQGNALANVEQVLNVQPEINQMYPIGIYEDNRVDEITNQIRQHLNDNEGRFNITPVSVPD